ncbi:MAG: DUF5343 domain-containing protein [Spirochaetia bacterium]|jgi:hypothetical protein
MPVKSGFTYVYIAAQIPKLLAKVQATGKPDKLTITHVQKSWLLKDAKYSAVLELLREMGFLDPSGVPTGLYSEYQNPNKAAAALTKGIGNAYPSLIQTYPKLHELPADQLKGYVKEHTGADESVVKKICSTITALIGLSSLPDSGSSAIGTPGGNAVGGSNAQPQPQVGVNPSIQLNIELHISPEMPEDKIEAIFRNMKKYLLTRDA